MMHLDLSAYLERPVDPNMDQLQFNSNIQIFILPYLPLVSSFQDFDSIKGIMITLCVLLVLLISSSDIITLIFLYVW